MGIVINIFPFLDRDGGCNEGTSMVMVGTPTDGSILLAAGTETLIPFAEEGITQLLLLLLKVPMLDSWEGSLQI